MNIDQRYIFLFLYSTALVKNTAWYDSEEARKVKNKEQNGETKDMYTAERKDAIFSQVAELHQQKSSVTTKTEQHSESKSSTEQVVMTSQQQQVQQQSSEEQITEWQKVAMKEKKHIQYAQESHFNKV